MVYILFFWKLNVYFISNKCFQITILFKNLTNLFDLFLWIFKIIFNNNYFIKFISSNRSIKRYLSRLFGINHIIGRESFIINLRKFRFVFYIKLLKIFLLFLSFLFLFTFYLFYLILRDWIYEIAHTNKSKTCNIWIISCLMSTFFISVISLFWFYYIVISS